MTRLFCLPFSLLFAAGMAIASTDAPTERELHTSECVAALDARSEELARQIKAGQSDSRPLLVSTLEAGAAFIGQAYLQGDRDEARSQSLLAAALQAQKQLPEADLATRQSACAQEGDRLLSKIDPIGRFVMSRLVQRRLQKLLGD
ncbi:MAG: hypothetical protein WCJ76_06010 [Comamonadaceae bacterium]